MLCQRPMCWGQSESLNACIALSFSKDIRRMAIPNKVNYPPVVSTSTWLERVEVHRAAVHLLSYDQHDLSELLHILQYEMRGLQGLRKCAPSSQTLRC